MLKQLALVPAALPLLLLACSNLAAAVQEVFVTVDTQDGSVQAAGKGGGKSSNPPPAPTDTRPEITDFGPGTIGRCNGNGMFALTYDDGPSEFTPAVLDVLKKAGVKASFFVLGQQVADSTFAETLKQAYSAGHIICNHTWSHRDLTTLSDDEIIEEVVNTQEIIFQTIGVYPRFFRPPYGAVNPHVADLINQRGLQVILWDVDTEDWEYVMYDARHSINVIDSYLEAYDKATNSWICLQHDILQETSGNQAEIIAYIQGKGYNLVTMDQCLGMSPYQNVNEAGVKQSTSKTAKATSTKGVKAATAPTSPPVQPAPSKPKVVVVTKEVEVVDDI